MVLNKSFKVLRRWRPYRSVLLECKSIPEESLLFESGTLNVLTPAEVDYIRKDYPDVETAYGCLGVLQGEGYLYLCLISGCTQAGKIGNIEVYCITKTSLIPLHASPYQHEGVVEMGKLLGCGQFYFSVGENDRQNQGFSLLSRAQKKGHSSPQFLWNRSLYVYLQRFTIDCSKWVKPIICGSVVIKTIYAGNKQVKACLISRISCERTGTRFNVRGLDDEGHVANFVETEQVMYLDNFIASFVQVRGLVPVFWDQPGLQTGTNRIRLSRGYHSSHPAFERHYARLLHQYGTSLSLDLLGNRDMEPLLSEAFRGHIAELSLLGATEYLSFDYHLHCRPGHTEALESILIPQCDEFIRNFGYYLEEDGEISKGQMGVVRHNCLDCLDRSNNGQAVIGLTVLKQQLEDLGVVLKPLILARFVEQYKSFWIQNGDNISKFYAGTRALDGKTKVAKIRDGARSVQRTIRNNFLDSSKQEAIDILLLNSYVGELGWKTRALLSPSDALAPLPIRRGLCNRWLEYTKMDKLRVCIGTWNVNGGKHIRSVALKNQSLHDWLLDAPLRSQQGIEHPEEFQTPADVYAIGCQELVGLTASNLVSASTSNRHEWAAELQKVLSRDTPYSLLTAEQLVGVCLYIFVRPRLVPFIRDVAVSSVKTGIGGKAGNKGGVAIRLLLNSTSMCFVCAHFAAHQAKVIERNNDFAEICRNVQFPFGQTIDSHDYVFWCGDLNYRIDLPNSLAKDSISKKEWNKLHRHEQLIKQKKLGKVFQRYSEGLLDFAPTFKYDMFSDDYDTSEKARVPAWCDRILWKRKTFLQPSKQVGMARVREDGNPTDTGNGEYGWHPSTVSRVNERELTSGHSDLSWWHPGRLLYYGRTELKTSDHRPVLALIEIDTYRVNESERANSLRETLKELGPPDSTVTITADNEDTNVIDNTKLVTVLQQYGRIVLVRSSDTCTLVTFSKSESALNALNFTGQQIDNIKITVKLKQPEYCFDYNDNVNIMTRAHLDEFTGKQDDESEYTGAEQWVESMEDHVQDHDIVLSEDDYQTDENQPLEQPIEEKCSPKPPSRPPLPRSKSPLPSRKSSQLNDRPPPPVNRPPVPTRPHPPTRPQLPHSYKHPQENTYSSSENEDTPTRNDGIPTKHKDNSSTGNDGPPTSRNEDTPTSENEDTPTSRNVDTSSSSDEEPHIPTIPTPEPTDRHDDSLLHEQYSNTDIPAILIATPTTNVQLKSKPKVPTRPPTMNTRQPDRLPRHPSPEETKPIKPRPTKYAPIKPACPPRPKVRSNTIDIIPCTSSSVRPAPPPRRPPPPYVSLFPGDKAIDDHKELLTRQLSDSSQDHDREYSDSSPEPADEQ